MSSCISKNFYLAHCTVKTVCINVIYNHQQTDLTEYNLYSCVSMEHLWLLNQTIAGSELAAEAAKRKIKAIYFCVSHTHLILLYLFLSQAKIQKHTRILRNQHVITRGIFKAKDRQDRMKERNKDGGSGKFIWEGEHKGDTELSPSLEQAHKMGSNPAASRLFFLL